jgi:hypothetical protein
VLLRLICVRIDPGNAFRIVVNVDKYKVNTEYAMVDMDEQQHVIWFDKSSGYNLARFEADMASKIYWGTNTQTLSIWSIDVESQASWKIRKNEHFESMIKHILNAGVAHVRV